MGAPELQVNTSSSVSVGNTSTTILTANSKRKYLALVNDSNETIYVNIGNAAVMNEGIRLNSNGGSLEMKYPIIYTDAIYGICQSGGKNLTVFEGDTVK